MRFEARFAALHSERHSQSKIGNSKSTSSSSRQMQTPSHITQMITSSKTTAIERPPNMGPLGACASLSMRLIGNYVNAFMPLLRKNFSQETFVGASKIHSIPSIGHGLGHHRGSFYFYETTRSTCILTYHLSIHSHIVGIRERIFD